MSNAEASQGSALSIGLRRYLYATAGITGAAVLIVEILGAKMLSPYFGTSHFVWTAQIAVTLVSLAAGYYLGGRLVDRSPKLSRLYFCILWAAAYLGLAVFGCEKVAYACLDVKRKIDEASAPNLALGALEASGILFFVPLTLLAAVCPFLVKILAVSFSGIGGQVGRLSAISTIGSVLGTVLIGYVLLPFLPNSYTMFITAGILAALVLVYAMIWGIKQGVAAPGLQLIVALAILLGGGGWGSYLDTHRKMDKFVELYRGNSNFGMLQVIETKSATRRFYLNDFLVQNTYDPGTKQSMSLFTYMLRFLAEGYRTNINDVLCIGLGVGIVPMDFARSGRHVDVVEINPAVVPVGEKYFGLEPAKLKINIGDGRYFLNTSSKQYDAVVLDAFLGDSSPAHLMTREAFAQVRRVLKPGGVLVINSFGDFRPGFDFLLASLNKTLGAVFKSVRIHATGNGNVFFAASDREQMDLVEPSTAGSHPEVATEVDSCLHSVRTITSAAGIILTDDYNPADFYDAKNRETHRRNLALSLKDI